MNAKIKGNFRFCSVILQNSLHGTDCFGVDERDVSGDDVVHGSVFVHEFHCEGSVVMLTTDLCRPVRLTTL